MERPHGLSGIAGSSLPRWIARTVGALDVLSGTGLVFAPHITLQLMLIPPPSSADALGFVRFVGAFVAAVGCSYLWGAAGDARRLEALFAFYLAPRLFVGIFAAWAVLGARWPLAWLVVAIVDLGLASAQAWYLRFVRLSHDTRHRVSR